MADVWARITVGFDRLVGRRLYRLHRFVYRWTGGLIGHRSLAGPMLLLTTIGRRSGQKRTTPLLYMPDPPGYVVVGSNGGRDQPPAWLLNVSSTPVVGLQVGRRKVTADAHVLTAGEQTALWPRLIDHYSGWKHYQQLTAREIHVVSFTPRPQR
jgi:deazaflavin-dependent oxidoreductase (nitroreductase family)